MREGKTKYAEFADGKLVKESKEEKTDLRNGTIVTFIPDETIFGKYHFITEYIDNLLWNYAFLNTGLSIYFNGQRYYAENGLLDLLTKYINGTELVYPIIHIKENDFEFAMTHSQQGYGEEYYSFVNGTNTTQGGTHQGAFREAVVKTIREFYKKDFDAGDIRSSIIAAISIKIQDPVFESQTKTKLGSQYMEPNGPDNKELYQ